MSNNTARLAREWAQFELDNAGEFSDKGRIAAAEHILATTTEPTMADVDWDTKKHRMAGADWDGHSPVIMIEEDYFGTIVAITDDGAAVNAPFKKDLTPNGKRYELREIGAPEQPEHPATLETVEDYENAPEGTVVASPIGSAWTKGRDGDWHRYGGWFTSDEMAHTERQVLRWGKHEDTSEPTVSLDENVGPDQPEHPETLVTVGDYENAPEGTIVARDDHAPLLKRGPNAWTTEYSSLAYDEDMARNPRQVLRWGWGK